jgi:hypothetical protein
MNKMSNSSDRAPWTRLEQIEHILLNDINKNDITVNTNSSNSALSNNTISSNNTNGTFVCHNNPRINASNNNNSNNNNNNHYYYENGSFNIKDNINFEIGQKNNCLFKTNLSNQSTVSSSHLYKPNRLIGYQYAGLSGTNLLFDREQKIKLLKRSISEKLRNSLKQNNNILHTNENHNDCRQKIEKITSSSSKDAPLSIEPRKWHSEKYKHNVIKLAPIFFTNNNSKNSTRVNAAIQLESNMTLQPEKFHSKNSQTLNFKQHNQKLNTKQEKPFCSNESKCNKMKICNTAYMSAYGKNLMSSINSRVNNLKFSHEISQSEFNQSSRKDRKKLAIEGKLHSNTKNEYDDDEEDDEDEEDSDFDDILMVANRMSHSSIERKKINRIIDNIRNIDDSYSESDDSELDNNFSQSLKKLSNKLNGINLVSIKSTNLNNKLEINNVNDENLIDLEASNYLYKITNNLNKLIMSNSSSNSEANHNLNRTNFENFDLIQQLSNENESSTNNESFYYEKSTNQILECPICYEKNFLNERVCCKFRVCNKCINTYVQTQIKECCGNVRIECLNSNCNKLMHKDEISERMARFDKNSLKNYLKFLVDANKDPNCKTCPRCSHVMHLDDYRKLHNTINNTENNANQNSEQNEIKDSKKILNEKASRHLNHRKILKKPLKLKYQFRRKKLKSNGIYLLNNNSLTKVQCNQCQLIWCYQCHAPWHDGVGCSEFKRGDKMLKYWAKEVHYGQQNAQSCPKCKIYIQRTKGCEHMVCTRCGTEFCYRCGEQFRHLKFVGKLIQLNGFI